MSRVIRASEIGIFVFCERAWGYAARGEPSQREAEMEAGRQNHAHRLSRVAWSGSLRRLGLACVTLALVALILAVTA